jgi:hypothetical protein
MYPTVLRKTSQERLFTNNTPFLIVMLIWQTKNNTPFLIVMLIWQTNTFSKPYIKQGREDYMSNEAGAMPVVV